MERTEGTIIGMFFAALGAAFVGALACGAILHLSFGEWAGWFSSPILLVLLAVFARKWCRRALK